jgi:transcriptional antiterminator
MKLLTKISSIFVLKEKTVRVISEKTGIPKSTVHYHKQKISERINSSRTDFWETDEGRHFIVRLVIGTIYMFALKSGNGAGRLHEFFKLLKLEHYTGVSETTILKIIREVEGIILEYKEAVEADISNKVEDIKVILGVDETWFDKMYLVCQELSSGYLFFEEDSDKRDAQTWDEYIKKTFELTS